ncbi:hypothetical protein SLA2020_335220 [Shorea laevis]
MDKLECMEDSASGLQKELEKKTCKSRRKEKKGSDSYEKMLQQNATKASELLAEKKRRALEEAHKNLKSQHNFLLSKDTNGNLQNFRCEHHDGVSGHRYRYVPPLTPEGFWNIGFDSEMS